MIPANCSGFIYHHCNVALAQALVLRLKSLKEGVRPKTKQDSQCESCLLCSLTPARLIRHKQITSDEACANQLLHLTLQSTLSKD